MHDFAGDVGQAVVAAGIAECQFLMVDAHQVQKRRVQVVNMHFVFDRVPAELVGGAVHHAAADAAAGQPHREAEGVMLAAIVAFRGRRATEFATPNDQRVIEQPAGFQVF